MSRLVLVASLFLAACSAAPAGPAPVRPSPEGSVAPRSSRAIDFPDRPLVVMNLAAHPDDEDGATLAAYRGAHDAVAYSVIYTRGEGGQNEAGPDLYERLGAVRTVETEAAARILGTQAWFLNFYDFGFSKHAEEAFDEWSRERRGFWDLDAPVAGTEAGIDRVTARLVRLIRRLKPDVLFTNHDTRTDWPDAQHGQHQVVGLSAERAFRLAADPSFHPEHLLEDGVDLWQPQRLFTRTRFFSADAPADVAVPISVPCAPFAANPAELCADRAVRAASQHVSQGFDVFAPRFRRDTTYFVLSQSADGAPPLPAGARDLAAGLSTAARPLALRYLVDSGRLPELAGVRVEDETVLPGGTTTLLPPDGAGRIAITDGDVWDFDALRDQAKAGPVSVEIPAVTAPSAPLYRAQYDRLTGSAAPFYVVFCPDTSVCAAGRVPLEVVPPLVLDLDPEPVLIEATTTLRVTAEVFDPQALAMRVHVDLSETPESPSDIETEAETLPASASEATLSLDVPDDLAPGRYVTTVTGALDTSDDPVEVRRPAVRLPDVSVADGLRVGLVRSYDDATEAALQRMGATVVRLDSAALAAGAFSGLDTIVIDIRASLVRPDLRAHIGQIHDWVAGGGHLVIGYHKLFEWNTDRSGEDGAPNPAIAPLPITLSRDRVVEETAEVEILDPEHAAWQAPHRIGPSDWDGWVQERGLYFPTEWAAAYAPLVRLGDTGETPLDGGILLAPYGEGTVLYSSLVWYRQLAALHGGAHRVFANLVSLPLTDGR